MKLKTTTLILLLVSLAVMQPKEGKAQEWLPKKSEEAITIANLAKELIRQDVDHWRIVLAQAIVESGWQHESYLFKKTNNFIGMRIPYARESTRVGAFKGYSVYATWQDCVKDIKLWQAANWDGGTADEYIALMHDIWSESPQYYSAVHFVTNRINNMIAQYKDEHALHFNQHVWQAYLQEEENKHLTDLQ